MRQRTDWHMTIRLELYHLHSWLAKCWDLCKSSIYWRVQSWWQPAAHGDILDCVLFRLKTINICEAFHQYLINLDKLIIWARYHDVFFFQLQILMYSAICYLQSHPWLIWIYCDVDIQGFFSVEKRYEMKCIYQECLLMDLNKGTVFARVLLV